MEIPRSGSNDCYPTPEALNPSSGSVGVANVDNRVSKVDAHGKISVRTEFNLQYEIRIVSDRLLTSVLTRTAR